jgi:hypothetical protein
MRGFRSLGFRELIKSRHRCTPEYDLRLSRHFGTSPGLWPRLQIELELMWAECENGEPINREVQPLARKIAEMLKCVIPPETMLAVVDKLPLNRISLALWR